MSVRDIVALTKPRLTALVLCTTAGGLWLAGGRFQTLRALLALIGTTLAVAGAHALNSWIERDLDALMERTRGRPLPTGRIDPRFALVLGVTLSILSIPTLWFGVNPLTGLLGALALGSYVLVYTPMKTRSPAALFVGAIPGALPPLMGWTAETGRVEWPGVVLFAILFVWQLPHFLAIAVGRKEDYARAGTKTFPLVHGDASARRHSIAYVLALIPLTLALVPLKVAGTLYLVAAGALGALFLWAAVAGWRAGNERRWARRLFFVSLAHLTGLFVALMVDAG